MKRHLRLRQLFETKRFNKDSWAIILPVSSGDVVALICEISLLLFDRSEQVSLLFESGQKLIVSKTDGDSRVSGSDADAGPLCMSRRDLESLFCFLLTWYRDGIAEVNHIDIELRADASVGQDCTIVIQSEVSQPPLPGNEAARIVRQMP